MEVYDGILDKDTLLSIYNPMVNSHMWSLSRTSERGTRNEQGCGFPCYPLKRHDVFYDVFLKTLEDVRAEHFERTGSKWTGDYLHRIDIVAKQPHVKTNLHYDVSPEDDPNKEAYSIIGMITPEWDNSWGGEFCTEKDTVPYEPGRFIVIKSTEKHNGYSPNQITPYWRLVVNYITK